MLQLLKIISGGQSGADRAGLDAALALGLEPGGWIPFGRRTDEGALPMADFLKYKLKQHPSPNYPPRTEQNVRESDATVIFGKLSSPGCTLTQKLCKLHEKPCLGNPLSPDHLREWVESKGIMVLNVAGNRERTNPGIYQLTFDTLIAAFRR
jgi:hypothetical protein